VEGVRDVHVNFTTGEATALVAEGGPRAADLVRAVREAGFDAGGATATIAVSNLRYAASINRLERELENVPGVLRASANQTTQSVEAEYVPGLVSARDLEQVIHAGGFALAAPIEEGDPIDRAWVREARATKGLAWQFASALVVTLLAIVASMPLMAESAVKGDDILVRLLLPLDASLRGWLPQLYDLNPLWLKLGLLVVTLVVMHQAGRQFYAAAWNSFRHHSADGNTLVALATGAAFVYSAVAVAVPAIWPTAGFPPDVYFESVNGILAFALLGRLIETKAHARTTLPVHDLMGLQPRVATVRRNGESEQVPAHQIRVGDRLVVSPGEGVAVDGTVTAGDSDLDMSMFPGGVESVRIGPGSRTPAGSVNRTALVEIEADTTSRKSALGQTVRIVEAAQFKKGPDQRQVDRLVARLVPLIIAVGLASVAAWVSLGAAPAVPAMLALATVTAIAAPTAVSFATSAAIRSATGQAAALGAVIRGGDVIDTLRRVDTVIFGKTGTITEGTPTVTHVVGAKRADNTTVNPAEILQVAAAVEARSEHPLAAAILASAKEKGVEVPGVERFVEMQGRGVRGIVGRFLVEVISVRHARERSLELGRLTKDVDRHVLAGRTPVVVVVNDVVRGLIIVADPTKANAKETISQLGDLGYTLFMLSGDSKATARLVAKENGIDRVVAEVEPRNKADEIKRFQEDGRVVAVIADGIDDAQALAQADVGIAIGAGYEIAMQASDVTLPGSDLQDVVTAVQIAQRTARTIQTNLRFAFLYNLFGIPLAAGVLYPVTGLLLTPMIAAAAASLATWFVVVNSLRLGRFNPTTTT
jgi:Cu+-exporting ATPase